VAVDMPDLWPFVKRLNSAVSFFQSRVLRRAVLKWTSEKCQTRGSGRMVRVPLDKARRKPSQNPQEQTCSGVLHLTRRRL
jgi:hypothetical protein